MPNYADPETALCAWFQTVLDTGPTGLFRRWVTELPGDLFSPTGMPCVVVQRFGGHDPYPGLDVARVDVDVYATGTDPLDSRRVALERAEDIRLIVRTRIEGARLGGYVGPYVSKARVMSAPTIRPFDSRHQVRRAGAAYELVLHRPI